MFRRTKRTFIYALAAVIVLAILALWRTGANSAARPPQDKISQTVTVTRPPRVDPNSLANAATYFEPNVGQLDSAVHYRARCKGYDLFLTDDEAVVALKPHAGSKETAPHVLRLSFEGGDRPSAYSSGRTLRSTSNYFIGNDPTTWRCGVEQYSDVRRESVYPGIDVAYYSRGRELEYDIRVAPGADARQIAMTIGGADRLELNGGKLLMHLQADTVTQSAPEIYQVVDGRRHAVEGGYVLKPDGRVGFDVGAYDRTLPLIIDPVVEFSTFAGGGRDDAGSSITVDAAGNVYVMGMTYSTDFPTRNAYQPAGGGFRSDIFVMKLNSAGELQFSTYLGGTGQEDTLVGGTIALDSQGSIVVSSTTNSTDFPLKNPLQATAYSMIGNVFITKLTNSGDALVFSTYLGGTAYQDEMGMILDRQDNIYLTGHTSSTDFPLVHPIQASNNGGYDAFVTKINASGTALVYSTYLGGSDSENYAAPAGGIAVDADGNAYVVGSTTSSDFPVVNAFQPAYSGNIDGFLCKLNPAGSALVFSTYLGGSDFDLAKSVCVDASGNIYVAGSTASVDFPVANAIQSTLTGVFSNAFVSKFNSTGSALIYSTYYGSGLESEGAMSMALGASGEVTFAGQTASADFPVVNPIQNTYGGGPSFNRGDATVVRLNPAGNAVTFATFYGGSGDDEALGLALDSTGNAYITGRTASPNFPTVSGFQTVNHGGDNPWTPGLDAFIAKIDMPSNHPPAILSIATALPNPAHIAENVALSAAASDPDGDILSYAWDFGDGATGSGATATHGYAAAGTYTATVLVSDGHGGTATSSVTVTVELNQPPPTYTLTVVHGSGSGSYAAGQQIEIVADAAPSGMVFVAWVGAGVSDVHASRAEVTMPSANAVVTATYAKLPDSPLPPPPPTPAPPPPASGGPVTPTLALPMNVTKMKASVNFKTANQDRCSISGVLLDLPRLFDPAGLPLNLSVGGATASFVLDAKGRGKSATGAVTLKFKPAKRNTATKKMEFQGGNVAFMAKLSKGDWAGVWKIDPSISMSKNPLTLNVSVELGGTQYAVDVPATCTSKAQLSGKIVK
jgi:hypothetical protein